jgi:glycosyltransferase involved in cell wall biosynthesis
MTDVSVATTISVIVCTRNRGAILTSCLDSIARAAATPIDAEVELIVVDNGSTDDTSAILHEWATTASISVLCISEPRAGLAVARNAGLRTAKGDLIAFTDDDCRLDETYFVDLLRHFAGDEVLTLRGGRVELGDPEDFPITIKTDDEIATYQHPVRPAGFIHGANLAMPHAVVDKVGSFDERLGAGTKFGGEDTDYMIRAHALGIRVQYVPDMIVYHFHGRRDLLSVQKLYASYMRANGALYIKHLRSSPLLIRLFWWDLRDWVRETLKPQPGLASEFDLGRRAVVVGNIAGMVSFSATVISARMRSLLRR